MSLCPSHFPQTGAAEHSRSVWSSFHGKTENANCFFYSKMAKYANLSNVGQVERATLVLAFLFFFKIIELVIHRKAFKGLHTLMANLLMRQFKWSAKIVAWSWRVLVDMQMVPSVHSRINILLQRQTRLRSIYELKVFPNRTALIWPHYYCHYKINKLSSLLKNHQI